MALATYSDLQSSITSWAMRSGDTQFAAAVPDFISLCEGLINYGQGDMMPLRCSEMETTSTASLSSGEVELPADYLEYRAVYATVSGRKRELKPANPADMIQTYDGVSGTPIYFSITGSTLFAYPSSDATTITLDYYAKIPALSNSNTTNWLLTKAPHLYLYGSLVQAAPFMMDDERIATWMQLYERSLAGLMTSDRRARFARMAVFNRGVTP